MIPEWPTSFEKVALARKITATRADGSPKERPGCNGSVLARVLLRIIR